MRIFLYMIAFIEGFLVMAFELLSARFISPHFGNSIYVWSSVLGTTLFSLLCGYYIGGYIVSKYNYRNWPYYLLLTVCTIIIVYPFLNVPLEYLAKNSALVSGSITAASLLLFLPLTILGSISPQLIQILSDQNVVAGKSSGNIYAISTLGGVLGTFLIGLYCIPYLGLKLTCGLIGSICGVILILQQILNKQKIIPNIIWTTLLIISCLITSSFTIKASITSPKAKTIYTNDDMMGKVEVVNINDIYHVVLNNGALQSKTWINSKNSSLLYVHIISSIVAFQPIAKRNNALIIGLAGGSLVKELNELGYKNIDVVDIDGRTREISNLVSSLNNIPYNFFNDDGRHYLLKSNKKYDVIIIDVSAGDHQPYHLFTYEALQLYKDNLVYDGMVIINIIDFIERSKTSATERIGDGLLKAGLKPYLLKNIYDRQYSRFCIENKIPYEKIIVGSNANYFSNGNYENLNPCCKNIKYNMQLHNSWEQMTDLKTDFSKGPFYDNIPIMEIMSFDKAKILRNNLKDIEI